MKIAEILIVLESAPPVGGFFDGFRVMVVDCFGVVVDKDNSFFTDIVLSALAKRK